jgi:hypothetical protein
MVYMDVERWLKMISTEAADNLLRKRVTVMIKYFVGGSEKRNDGCPLMTQPNSPDHLHNAFVLAALCEISDSISGEGPQ